MQEIYFIEEQSLFDKSKFEECMRRIQLDIKYTAYGQKRDAGKEHFEELLKNENE